jgi:hypothetical protein
LVDCFADSVLIILHGCSLGAVLQRQARSFTCCCSLANHAQLASVVAAGTGCRCGWRRAHGRSRNQIRYIESVQCAHSLVANISRWCRGWFGRSCSQHRCW